MIDAVKIMSIPENSIQMRNASNQLKTSLRTLAKIPDLANTIKMHGGMQYLAVGDNSDDY